MAIAIIINNVIEVKPVELSGLITTAIKVMQKGLANL